MRTQWSRLVLAVLVSVAVTGCQGAPQAAAQDATGYDVEAWARVLDNYQRPGGLAYAALQTDRQDLDVFLDSLAATRPDEMSAEEQKAFWCNAYNAVMVHYVLERYPDIESVQEIDGVFDELRFAVAGEELTLDEIETRARDLGDPRVHFAVVCASTSCPDLGAEPYRGEEIDQQLDDDMRTFLADPTKGLRYDEESNTLWLSSIFKWYAGDFTGGSTVVAFFARGKVVGWLLPRLPSVLAETIERREPRVRYLDYDWGLNDRSQVSSDEASEE